MLNDKSKCTGVLLYNWIVARCKNSPLSAPLLLINCASVRVSLIDMYVNIRRRGALQYRCRSHRARSCSLTGTVSVKWYSTNRAGDSEMDETELLWFRRCKRTVPRVVYANILLSAMHANLHINGGSSSNNGRRRRRNGVELSLSTATGSVGCHLDRKQMQTDPIRNVCRVYI